MAVRERLHLGARSRPATVTVLARDQIGSVATIVRAQGVAEAGCFADQGSEVLLTATPCEGLIVAITFSQPRTGSVTLLESIPGHAHGVGNAGGAVQALHLAACNCLKLL